MSDTVDEADVVDRLARVVTLVALRYLQNVQLKRALAGLGYEPKRKYIK